MMENFENHFKDNLEDIDELPPSDGWQRISGALDDEGKRHTYVWAAILFLIFLSADSVDDRKIIAGVDHVMATSNTLSSFDSVKQLSSCLPSEWSTGNLSGADGNTVAVHLESQRNDDSSRIMEDHKTSRELVEKSKRRAKNDFTPGIGTLNSQQEVQPSIGWNSKVIEHSNVLNFGDSTIQIMNGESMAFLPSSVIRLYDDEVAIDGQSNNTYIEKEGSISSKVGTLSFSDEQDSSRLVTLVLEEVIKGKDKDKEGSREKKRFGKWYYQANLGLNYTMKKINPTEDIYYMARLNNTNQFTWKNAGYQLSFRVRREVNHKYTFVAGASYSWLRETTNFDYYNIIADSLVIGNVSETEIQVQTYSPVRYNVVENSVSYGGITLGMMRKINLLRIEQSIFIEGRYNRVLSHSHHSLDRDHRFSPNPNQLFIKAGLEKCFKLYPKYLLSVAPFAQYSFGSIYGQESLYSLRPIQIGIDLGIVILR